MRIAAVVACAMACAFLAWPASVARADDSSAEATTDELQQRVEDSSNDYDAAVAQVDELQSQIDDNQALIASIEAELPEQRERASDAVRALYKLQQGTSGVLGLILSADDFSQLISTLEYLNVIQSKNLGEVQSLSAMEDQLEQARTELASEKAQADQQLATAQEALATAQAARQAAQERAAEQAQEQAAEAQAAVQAAQQATASSASATFVTESGNTASVSVPSSDTPSSVDWSSDKAAFVASWGARIDAYLSGSPLEGEGTTFAEAAWDYGVDPRWSPAISNTESSKGLYCFRPHNAWGWGNSSWGSWDEAIRAHVAGLAAEYGYTITVAAAQEYCPPNWESWYSSTLAEMESI